MDYIEQKTASLKERYGKYIKREGGSGIFSLDALERLVGDKRPFDKNQSTYNFWSDRRKGVRNSLIDLALFLEVAGQKNVDQVFTLDAVKPVVDALFWADRISPESDIRSKEKALIAQYFIESGFRYLTFTNPYYPQYAQRIVEDAVDLSRNFAAMLIPEKERPYYGPWPSEKEVK
jgi:hypothetical protein